MAKTTITEALAELKVVDKRILSKQQFIGTYVLRQVAVRDPLEKAGGSYQEVSSAIQSIRDLMERKLSIRRAIQAANTGTDLVVGGETRSIADWLVWKRDVAPVLLSSFEQLQTQINQKRGQAQKEGRAFVQPGQASDAKDNDIVVNLNERELAQTIEDLRAKIETLDGKLSLANARVEIEV